MTETIDIAPMFDLAAIVLGLAAVFGYLNHRWLRLPHTIGLVVIALVTALAALGIDLLAGAHFAETVRYQLGRIDFHETLMKGMLSFLLFAGALHVDLEFLALRKWPIAIMATVGVVISTALIGTGAYFALGLIGIGVPFVICLIFGALISPTDPVAVLSILKSVTVPKTLEAKIAGESLFNDGVGVVLFTIIVAIAFGDARIEPTVIGIATLFAQEALGGAALGALGGGIAFLAMRSIDQHDLEVIITLALVTVVYAIAGRLHVSGPIAVVVAGLLIGNHGTRLAMSETTRDHIQKFWSLIDEILNSVLFLIIGFEVVAIGFAAGTWIAVAVAIPLVLLARLISVGLPMAAMRRWQDLTPGAVPVLVWGGLRGGISVALALAIPANPDKDLILAMTYGVVIFSIIVQGLTVGRLVDAVVRE